MQDNSKETGSEFIATPNLAHRKHYCHFNPVTNSRVKNQVLPGSPVICCGCVPPATGKCWLFWSLTQWPKRQWESSVSVTNSSVQHSSLTARANEQCPTDSITLWSNPHPPHGTAWGWEGPWGSPRAAQGDMRHMSQLGLLLKSPSYKTQLQQLNTSKTI